MFCPGCSRRLKTDPKHRVALSETQEHLWDICPHCGELVHYIRYAESGRIYAWAAGKESKYRRALSALRDRRNILYIPRTDDPGGMIALCRKFTAEHRWNAGFVIAEAYREQAEILSCVHPTVILPEVLFPAIPSFPAEKIITETLVAELFSTCAALNGRFRIWKND